MKKIVKFGLGLAVGAVMSIGVAQAATIDGVWRTPKGWKVKIYKCGSSHCGRVIGGTRDKDVKNPNKALRKRKVVGIRMIWGMKKSGSTYSGKLYNPKDGKVYTGKISVNSSRSLKLSGCVFGGLVCKGQTWRK